MKILNIAEWIGVWFLGRWKERDCETNRWGKTSEKEANSQEIKIKEFYNLKMHKHQVKR